jgi:ABC-type transport system involved in multi-copper enzyme maturation permease subunit
MSIVGAIMRREMFVRVRQGKFYLARMAFVLPASGLLVLGFAAAARMNVTTTGLQIVTRIASFLMIAACFAAPMSAAPLLAQEKEDGTLGLLLLSDTRPWQIVLGKLLPSLSWAAMMVLSGLPLLVLCVNLGGVSTPQILATVAILLAATFLGSCLGLCLSACSGTGRRAVVAAVLCGLLLFGALPFALEAWSGFRGAPAWLQGTLPVVSPFHALAVSLSGTALRKAWWNCAFDVAAALPLLFLAVGRIPRLTRQAERRGIRVVRSRGRRPALRGNAVAWKERISSLPPRMAWLLCALTSAASVFLAGLIANSKSGAELAETLAGGSFRVLSLSFVAFVSAVIFSAGVVSVCTMSFAREKREHTLDLLLITDLGEQDIVLGKLWAPVAVCTPWLAGAGAAALLLWPSLDLGLEHKALLIVTHLSLVFGAACLGLYFSLRYRPHAAVGLTALLCIAWVTNMGFAAMGVVGAPAIN